MSEQITEKSPQETTAVRPLEVITAEIRICKQQAGAALLEIGKRLIEAKAQLGHGEWLSWLKEEVEFSEVTAQRFMRLAREYPNPSPVTDLGATKALVLLALPVSEREEFVAEKHVVDGREKTVQEMSKRELEKAIRERDEARMKQHSAEDILSKLKMDVSDLEQERDIAAERAEKAEMALREAQAQLEGLKERPSVGTVETVVDTEAIKEAVDTAREALKKELDKKIDKAQREKEEAEAARKKAEQALTEARAAQGEDRKQIDRLTAQLAEAKKRAAVTPMADASVRALAEINLLFRQIQTEVAQIQEKMKSLDEVSRKRVSEVMQTVLQQMQKG